MSGHTFTRDDLLIVYPMDYIVKNESVFFPKGKFDPDDATGYIVTEALRCGVRHVAVECRACWWIVRSDKDWLTEPDKTRAFRIITPYREGGDNSMRPEILLTAFCRVVITATQGHVDVVKGAVDREIAGDLRVSDAGRVIVFTPQ